MKKLQTIRLKKLPAFNLQELLVVLVIIGILILIALPNLMPMISKAKSIEAQSQLTSLHGLQRTHFYMHSKYSTDLNTIDFIAPKTVKEGGRANYMYEVVEATNTTFKARATSITDFNGDGKFNVWEIDQDQNLKEVAKD
ncbi:prepilin-type N-terminal cleavage/methylation domain-containing protein [Winogradskyella sp.]|uniref:prepilin-type N-terminal cleavage/methylation domain-containing protein n=1 Tax=Winogradskyella sp. TaxID=1883156 RepID=UPI003AB83A55